MLFSHRASSLSLRRYVRSRQIARAMEQAATRIPTLHFLATKAAAEMGCRRLPLAWAPTAPRTLHLLRHLRQTPVAGADVGCSRAVCSRLTARRRMSMARRQAPSARPAMQVEIPLEAAESRLHCLQQQPCHRLRHQRIAQRTAAVAVPKPSSAASLRSSMCTAAS